MRTLLVDTAGPVVGVAAFDGDDVVAAASERIVQGADAWLSPRVADLLGRLDARGGLDRVAVCVGPGAFTGLRVGVATALGLALARGVGVVPLSSLALRAAAVPGERRVLALLDAKKGRVYAGVYDTRAAVPTLVGDEADVPPADAAKADGAVATGEGAVVYRALLEAAGHRVSQHAAESPVAAGAALVRLCDPLPIEQIGLRYLREPDARPTTV